MEAGYATPLFAPRPTQGEAGDRTHYRASSSDLPAFATNPPTRIVAPRAHTTPSSTANTGLKALFQAPTALGGSNPPAASSALRRAGAGNPKAQRLSGGPGPGPGRSRPALPEMDSTSSLKSRYSRSSVDSSQFQPPLAVGGSQGQRRVILPYTPPPSYPGSSNRNSAPPLRNRPATEALPNSDKPSAARGRTLSQLFVYQPRVVTSPSLPSSSAAAAAAAAVAAGDAVLYELDGVVPTVARPTEIEVSRRPRKGSAPEASTNVPRISVGTAAASQEQEEGLRSRNPEQRPVSVPAAATHAVAAASVSEPQLLPDPGSRRHALDSAAWQRRTRLFQMEDHGIGVSGAKNAYEGK